MSLNLAKYNQAIGTYQSQLSSASAFVDRYSQQAQEKFAEQVARSKEIGQGLLEAGVGLPHAFKGIKAGYDKLKKLRKKKEGDEDGNDDEDGDSTEQVSETPEGTQATEETEIAPAEEAEAEGDFADVSALPSEVEMTGISGDVGAFSEGRSAQSEILDADPEDLNAMDQGVAGDLGGGGEALDGVAGAGEATATAGEVTGEVGGTIAGAIGGEEAGGIALADVAAAAPEIAIPVAAVAAIGYGLYDLFKHHHHDPPPTPNTTATMRGEIVTPSFDGVIDTPATNAAF